MTNLRLKVVFGNSENSTRITPISNQVPEESDLFQLMEELKSKRLDAEIPTAKGCQRHMRKVKKMLKGYVRTDGEIAREVQLKKDLNQTSVKNLALDINIAKVAVTEAREKSVRSNQVLVKLLDSHPDKEFVPSSEAMDTYDEEDEEPDDPIEAGERSIVKAAKEDREAKLMFREAEKGLSKLKTMNELRLKEHAKAHKVGAWQKINDKARGNNKEADYNTFKEMRKKKEEKKGKETAYNPFARRPNKPKILWAVTEGDKSKKIGGDGEEKEGEEKDGGAEEVEEKRMSQGSNAALTYVYDQEAIDREAAEKIRVAKEKKKQMVKGGEKKERNGLSFADYLKKKKKK